MTQRHVWIALGLAGAALALGYLATKREINATVTAGEATVTYLTGEGAQNAQAPQEDSHARMLRLIEQSERAIADHDAVVDVTEVVR